ncbi:MAG: sugar phosphate isomerase/epimerase family protein [Pirellulaceae bacterium]
MNRRLFHPRKLKPSGSFIDEHQPSEFCPRFVRRPACRHGTRFKGRASDDNVDADSLEGRLYKTLKIGMVQVPGSLSEKFAAVKAAGYDGIEMDSPGMDVEATKKAIADSGLPVDGTVCSSHWSIRHSSADAEQRAKAAEDLKHAIRSTHAVGGHTVLLVVGHGNDGSEQEVWDRSVENIAKAIPLAAELGVYIAFENVWNQFCYDHSGGPDQTAEKYVQYVDVFNSPWIGMQFDIGNHWKYGNIGDWIRARQAHRETRHQGLLTSRGTVHSHRRGRHRLPRRPQGAA